MKVLLGRQTKLSTRILLSASVALFTIACGSDGNLTPITKETATETARSNIASHAEDIRRSFALMDQLPLRDILVILTGGHGDVCDAPEDRLFQSAGSTLSSEFIAIVDDTFRTQLATSLDGSTIVYAADQASCEREFGAGGCRVPVPGIDLKIRVTSSTPGDLDLRFLVGPDETVLANWRLYREKIDLEIDLAHLKSVFEAPNAGPSPPDLPEVMEGVVSAVWRRGADGHPDLTIAALSDIRVAYQSGQSAGLSLQLGTADPLVTFKADYVKPLITIDSKVPALELATPGSQICDGWFSCGDAERQGIAKISSPGGFHGTFDVNAQSLNMTQVGFGDGTAILQLNDADLFRADVNESRGRAFNAAVHSQPDNIMAIEVQPAIDLKAAATLMRLSEQMRIDLPNWLLDELFDISLGGDPGARFLIPGAANSCEQSAGWGIPKLEQGTLRLGAVSSPNDTVINEGQCIDRIETNEEHFLAQIGGVPCP